MSKTPQNRRAGPLSEVDFGIYEAMGKEPLRQWAQIEIIETGNFTPKWLALSRDHSDAGNICDPRRVLMERSLRLV